MCAIVIFVLCIWELCREHVQLWVFTPGRGLPRIAQQWIKISDRPAWTPCMSPMSSTHKIWKHSRVRGQKFQLLPLPYKVLGNQVSWDLPCQWSERVPEMQGKANLPMLQEYWHGPCPWRVWPLSGIGHLSLSQQPRVTLSQVFQLNLQVLSMDQWNPQRSGQRHFHWQRQILSFLRTSMTLFISFTQVFCRGVAGLNKWFFNSYTYGRLVSINLMALLIKCSVIKLNQWHFVWLFSPSSNPVFVKGFKPPTHYLSTKCQTIHWQLCTLHPNNVILYAYHCIV